MTLRDIFNNKNNKIKFLNTLKENEYPFILGTKFKRNFNIF